MYEYEYTKSVFGYRVFVVVSCVVRIEGSKGGVE